MEHTLIHHRRSWKSIATRESLLLVFAVVFCAFLAYCFRSSTWVLVGIALLFLFNAVMAVHTAWIALRDRVDFHCVLTSDRISCRSPSCSMGGTFSISIDELAEIVEDASGECRQYYLVTRSGQTHWLTSNFGTPSHHIVKHLRRLRPDLPLAES